MVTTQFNILGLMSGTSLDGLDLAHVSFENINDRWSFKVNAAQTVEYSAELRLKLQNAFLFNGLELSQLNVDLGKCFGEMAKNFLEKIALPTDFISSHGHTIYHQPQNGLTLQIGSPAHIAAITGHAVVADFRTTDVALGGNGAPLVPIGDMLLFNDYDVCVNLGGIANFSFNERGLRKAFDVCPFNMVFNHFAQQMQLPFDEGGQLTASGQSNAQLFAELNKLSFYQLKGPKSLGKEWVDAAVIPLLEKANLSIADTLNTFCSHVVYQLTYNFPSNASKVLLTGGGAFHSYFVSELQQANPKSQVIVPDDLTVQYKEAVIFALLGLLRWQGKVNSLASVTGAQRDNIGGAVYL